MNAQTPIELATLGGGCFWCIEAGLQSLTGVIAVDSGYAGGSIEHPSYRQVCRGDSGHAEVVQVRFDPRILDYRMLLICFFSLHDPTTPDRQGNDIGPQYRSVVFTHSEAQTATTKRLIAELGDAHIWPDPIVTAIQPAPTFWPAEEEHRNYYARNPEQGYCRVVIAPKLAKLRQKLATMRG